MDDFEGAEGEARQFTAEYLEIETLNRRVNLSVQVIADLQKKGPIYHLVMAKRQAALAAMDALIDADPNEPATIAVLQQKVMSFIGDCQWINGVNADGKHADQEIIETWGVRGDGRPDRDSEAD